MKREAELKRAFTAEMKRQLPGFLILQYATAGAPDREIVGAGITTRWECKNGTPSFDSPGVQELMMCRLAACAHAKYIVWQSIRGIDRTLIVDPLVVHRRTSWLLEAETSWPGFDMKALVRYIGQVHGITRPNHRRA